MISENRNPDFWREIAAHPQVAPHVSLGMAVDVGELVSRARVVPLASEHGGFLLFQLDGFGRMFELHTMFTPEGWGREVLSAAKEMHSFVFNAGVEILTTLEVKDHWRSQPPKSFGWQQTGDFRAIGDTQTEGRFWFLTRDAWWASPAFKRMKRKCQ